MKRNILFGSIVLSVALSAMLTGCGSASAATDSVVSDDTSTQTSITGNAVDGYLQYATVCLDLSGDGYCQSVEPHTQTDENGSFTLELTDAHKADENFDEALLLVFGGVDADTGKDFRGKLYAANDGSEVLNISPITTLVAKHVAAQVEDQNLTREQIRERIQEAKAKVAAALDIDEDAITLDPVAYQKSHGDDKLIRQALKVQKAVEALMFAANLDESAQKEQIEAIYEALAESLEEVSTDNRGVEKLFEKAATKAQFQNMFKHYDKETILAIAEAITGNLDIAFDNIEADDDQLEKIAAIVEDALSDIDEDASDDSLDSISGIIYLEDDERYKGDFDWGLKYLENDLEELDIEVSDALLEKLQTLFAQMRIKPGMLFIYADMLNESGDEELQALYTEILAYKEALQNQKEAEEAEYDDIEYVDLTSMMAGETLYLIERVKECTYTSMQGLPECDITASVTEIIINEDATQAIVNGESSQIEIDGRVIYVSEEGSDDIFTLVFKEQNEDYISFYRNKREVIKLYTNVEALNDELSEYDNTFTSDATGASADTGGEA